MIKAISPKETTEQYVPDIPDFIIEVINNLIISSFNQRSQNCKSIKIYFDDVRKLIEDTISKHNLEHNTNHTYKKHYLDIENVYRQVGWKIIIDNPSYNESYRGSWEFTKP